MMFAVITMVITADSKEQLENDTEALLTTARKHLCQFATLRFQQVDVDTNNRLICYDILDLGKQLMPIGMLVVLDSILNRITQNRAKGKNTFI